MKQPRVSDSELEVLKLLWENEPLSANEMAEKLCTKHEWAEPTVKSFLARLVKKGIVAQRRLGRNFEYRPLVSRSEYIELEGDEFINKFFNGAAEEVMMFFARKARVRPGDWEQLEKIIREQEENG